MSNIVNAEVTMSSLELLEIINKARVEFGESSIRNNDFLKRVKAELEGDAYESFVTAPEGGGTPMEVLQLTHDQCMLVAMRESKGVRRKVLQKLKNNEQAQLKPPVSQTPALPDITAALEIVARSLNVCESGKLAMFGAAFKRHGVNPTGLLPAYAIDAPTDSSAGSAEVTKSLTELLKEFGFSHSAKTINPLLEEAGMIRREYRASTGGKQKGFWSITEQGLRYGKNVVSASGPKETQPHWYISRFSDLMAMLETRH